MTFKFPPRNALGAKEKKAINQVVEFYKKKKLIQDIKVILRTNFVKNFLQ